MDFEVFRKELIGFLNTSGVSQNELSVETNVAQSQISGWVNGKGMRFGRVPKKVMDYIDEQNRSEHGFICPELERTIINFCGNSQKKSKALIAMIEAIGGI